MSSIARTIAVVALAAAVSAEPQAAKPSPWRAGLASLLGAGQPATREGAYAQEALQTMRQRRSAMGQADTGRTRRQAGSGSGSGSDEPTTAPTAAPTFVYFQLAYEFTAVPFADLSEGETALMVNQVESAYCTANPVECALIETTFLSAIAGATRRGRRQSGGTRATIIFTNTLVTTPPNNALPIGPVSVGGVTVAAVTSQAGTITTEAANNYQAPSVAPTPDPISGRYTTGGEGGEGGKSGGSVAMGMGMGGGSGHTGGIFGGMGGSKGMGGSGYTGGSESGSIGSKGGSESGGKGNGGSESGGKGNGGSESGSKANGGSGKGGSGKGSGEGGKGERYAVAGAMSSASGITTSVGVAGVAAGIALVAGLSLVAARGRQAKKMADGFVDETTELLASSSTPLQA